MSLKVSTFLYLWFYLNNNYYIIVVPIHTNEKKGSKTNIITVIDIEWIKNFTEKNLYKRNFFTDKKLIKK